VLALKMRADVGDVLLIHRLADQLPVNSAALFARGRQLLVHGMRADEWIVTAQSIGLVTGPRIACRICDHRSTNGIEFDMPVTAQQVDIAVD
jgi:hypothetical protein